MISICHNLFLIFIIIFHKIIGYIVTQILFEVIVITSNNDSVWYYFFIHLNEIWSITIFWFNFTVLHKFFIDYLNTQLFNWIFFSRAYFEIKVTLFLTTILFSTHLYFVLKYWFNCFSIQLFVNKTNYHELFHFDFYLGK